MRCDVCYKKVFVIGWFLYLLRFFPHSINRMLLCEIFLGIINELAIDAVFYYQPSLNFNHSFSHQFEIFHDGKFMLDVCSSLFFLFAIAKLDDCMTMSEYMPIIKYKKHFHA